MAGYTVKITIEDTHPPVWRRVILPEKITFENLHDIIQIVFGWEDYHLHDFSFPQTDFRIVKSREDAFGDYALEDSVCIDEFLKGNKWIRYTYDFGDDWKHKIVLEKEIPDYEERYASVIKYKGDNICEDSGGVWFSEEREPFSSEEVNVSLQRYVCPLQAIDRRVRSTTEQVIREQKMEKDLQDFGKLFKKLMKMERDSGAAIVREKKPSALDRQMEEWESFIFNKLDFEEFMKQFPDIREAGEHVMEKPEAEEEKEEPEYVQLTLPFVELAPEPEKKQKTSGKSRGKEAGPDTVPEEESYIINVKQSSLTKADMLSEMSPDQAKDYCRYLQIDCPGRENQKNRIHRIAKVLAEHPEYNYYILNRKELKALKNIWENPDSIVSRELTDAEEDAVGKAISLGLLRVDIHHNHGKHIAELSFAVDAADLLGKRAGRLVERIHDWLERLEKNVKQLVLYYGVIEIDVLYQKFIGLYSASTGKEDFFRFIYWHCKMCGLLVTFTDIPAHNTFCALPHLDIDRIFQDRAQFATDLDYYPLSKEELLVWEMGLAEYYEAWYAVYPFLLHVADIPEDTVYDVLDGLLYCILNGGTLQAVYGILEEYCPVYCFQDIKVFWEVFMPVVMQTALPGLKGHSREDVLGRGKNVDIPPAVSQDKLTDHIDTFTHIMDMPWDIQLKLYEIIHDTEPKASIRTIKIMRREISMDNLELILMQAEYHTMAGEFGMAEELVSRAKKLDPDSQNFYEDYLKEIRQE